MMLSVHDALTQILKSIRPLGTEVVDLSTALGRALGSDLVARRQMPPFTNSAMDGYAVRSVDVERASAEHPLRLSLIDTIPAGQEATRPLEPGTAMRIFTGAPMPDGADAVVMQEHTDKATDASYVCIKQGVSHHENVRLAGEDISIDSLYAKAGVTVDAGLIGMLASQGQSFVHVHRRPRVAILSTGDEIREIDQPLAAGQISNSNSHMLAAQVVEASGIPIRLPTVPDNAHALKDCLTALQGSADLILTCGGVSVGDYDLVRSTVAALGSIEFWKIALKPGKPLAFGHLAGVPFIGLPGNPASAFVCFELFARKALRRLAGHHHLHRLTMTALLSEGVKGNTTRDAYLRGTLSRQDGQLWTTPHAKQGSGQQSSLLKTDVLMRIPAGKAEWKEGEPVDVILLHNEF